MKIITSMQNFMKTPTPYFVLLLGVFILNISCSKDDGPITEEVTNDPPLSFYLLNVENGAINVDVKPNLTWETSTDPEGGTVTYDLYLSTDEEPAELYAADLTETSFEVNERLSTYETYYWKVVAKDQENATTSSQISEFTVRGLNFSETPVVKNAPCLPRQSHTMEVYQDKMWLLGGFYGGLKNDVWSSIDGVAWTELTQVAPFSARNGHTSSVFKDKLWIIGGWSEGEAKNDVLFSEDGINWTEAIKNAPFSGRFGHTTVVFKNKLWVIAGTADDDTAIHDNDVWYSEDGVNWTAATANAPFSGRYGHTTVVFDDRLWVMGGRDNGGVKNDVWYSNDGVNWTEATPAAPFTERYFYAATIFDDKIWVIDEDIWFSTDGINWTEATDAAPYSDIRSHTTATFNDKIWVVGGFSGGAVQTDIWSFD